MDVFDGHNPHAQKISGQDVSIKDKPSLLEVVAHAYFPSASLVGPQFPLWRLRQFIDGKMLDPKTNKPYEEA